VIRTRAKQLQMPFFSTGASQDGASIVMLISLCGKRHREKTARSRRVGGTKILFKDVNQFITHDALPA
jgi:hypothetical protein